MFWSFTTLLMLGFFCWKFEKNKFNKELEYWHNGQKVLKEKRERLKEIERKKNECY